MITGSGAARAGAIFLPFACVRWRGLGQGKGARAGVAHWLRCATPGGGAVCHRAGTLPPVRDAGLAGAGHPTCARLASHPWPLASRSGPAARVPFLVGPLRGRPGGACACPAPARRHRCCGVPVDPRAAGLSPAGNGKAYVQKRVRMVGCLLDSVCSPRIVPSDPRETRGILMRWMFVGRGSCTCMSVAHMLEDVFNS